MLELVGQSIASGIAIGCVYGLVGIGFCVIYNGSGIVNFAQGAFVMLGGMLTYVALKTYGIPLPVAAPIAIALVSMLGIVLERVVVRRPVDHAVGVEEGHVGVLARTEDPAVSQAPAASAGRGATRKRAAQNRRKVPR